MSKKGREAEYAAKLNKKREKIGAQRGEPQSDDRDYPIALGKQPNSAMQVGLDPHSMRPILA